MLRIEIYLSTRRFTAYIALCSSSFVFWVSANQFISRVSSPFATPLGVPDKYICDRSKSEASIKIYFSVLAYC